jgi:hypothetical protein
VKQFTLRRVRHPRLILAGLAMIVLITIELVRIITAQATLNQAVYDAARYAVTLEYDPTNCPKTQDCTHLFRLTREERQALEDKMRLRTVYGVAQSHLSSNRVVAAARIVVCSNRPGFAYDPVAEQCWPRNDVGGQGDRVIVHISHDYPLGSFLGLNLGSVPLDATYQMIVESDRNPRIPGLPPTIMPMATPTYPAGPAK